MNNRRTIWLIAIGIAFLAVIILLIPDRGYNWEETYAPQSKEPYGTTVLKVLLADYFPESEVVDLRDSFALSLPIATEDSVASANFVFVGAAMHLRPSDVQQLLDFADRGNQVFISARVLPFNLMFELYFDHCDEMWWDGLSSFSDTVAYAGLLHPRLRQEEPTSFYYQLKDKKVSYYWHYFDAGLFCGKEDGLVPIGRLNDSLTDFVQRPYGEGSVYLHANPLALTNFHLLREEGIQYADRLFSHLKPGPIYWDDYSAISESLGEAINDRRRRAPTALLNSDSPLQFILSRPPLAWAWYLLLLTGLLYIIFVSRRRQRIIPLIRKNVNSSLEFVNTIGRLYFQQGDHRQLAGEKMQSFRSFVRQRYSLSGPEPEIEHRQALLQRSGIRPEQLENIVSQYNLILNTNFVSAKMLIGLHQGIEYFYQHCK